MFKAYSFVLFALFAIVGTASLFDSPSTNSGKTYSLASVYVDKTDTVQASPPEIEKRTEACQETKVLC